jgi:hypothetical protein
MLDYSTVGVGRAQVIFVDFEAGDQSDVVALAPDFETFLLRLTVNAGNDYPSGGFLIASLIAGSICRADSSPICTRAFTCSKSRLCLAATL